MIGEVLIVGADFCFRVARCARFFARGAAGEGEEEEEEEEEEGDEGEGTRRYCGCSLATCADNWVGSTDQPESLAD